MMFIQCISEVNEIASKELMDELGSGNTCKKTYYYFFLQIHSTCGRTDINFTMLSLVAPNMYIPHTAGVIYMYMYGTWCTHSGYERLRNRQVSYTIKQDQWGEEEVSQSWPACAASFLSWGKSPNSGMVCTTSISDDLNFLGLPFS